MEKSQKNVKNIEFLTQFNDFTVIAPQNTYIEVGAKIGKSTIIYPNCYIDKNSKIGANCCVFSGCVLEGTSIDEGSFIGPFAHTRSNSIIGKNVRLGNFCETKNCKIGDNTKIAHLTYVGDAEIGQNCNFGCGVVFANFDGINKYKIVIGDNCFIGCNVNLIAPLKIGSNSFIGANTVVDKDLDTNTFALARPPLIVKNNKKFNKKC